MPDARPNLLLITTDQQRHDALGINGNRILQTQNLDNLAASGMNFTRAYTTCPSCIAARRSILTGQAPATHGLCGYSETHPFNPEFTLPGLLRDAGYQTQLVGKLHQMPQRRRFGFDNMILSNAPSDRPDSAFQKHNDYVDWLKDQGIKQPPHMHGINGNSRLARPSHLDEFYHQTTWVTTQAIDFLTKKRDPSCPYFLHLSYWAPHPPLVPPQAYYDRYVGLDGMEPVIGEWAPKGEDFQAGVHPTSATGPFSKRDMVQAKAGYYGLINHIDDQVQRLLEDHYQYGGTNGKDPLYIIYTSDHGEMLGDHHLFRKSIAYESSAHVPFFISGRNVDLPKGGAASETLTCLEDLLPTFCDLAGVDIPDKVDGKSLVPVLRGEKETVRDELHGEHSGGFAHHFIVRGPHKYIWHAKTNEEQLFDLAADPQETRDLSGQAELLKPFRNRMAEYIAGRDDYSYDVAKLTPCANKPPKVFWS